LLVQLTDELNRPEPSLDRVAQIISRDIGMSTKILQLVNSAFFGLPHSVHSMTEAVTHLGLATVRSLAVTLQVFSQFDARSCEGFSLDSLANHSWVTAVAARRIAREERKNMSTLDQCFLAGLVHDVGKLVLATGSPDEYRQVLQAARSENRPDSEVEREAFGATHAEVGAYLLGLWGLPNPIIEAVAMHHDPGRCVVTDFSPLVAVHVAGSFVHDQLGAGNGSPHAPLDMDFLTRLGLNTRIESWRAVCTGDLDN
jgi:HD-like signal output (HDOD) protein